MNLLELQDRNPAFFNVLYGGEDVCFTQAVDHDREVVMVVVKPQGSRLKPVYSVSKDGKLTFKRARYWEV